MSTPPTGVSGSAGVTMSDVTFKADVTPQSNGDVRADLDCNGMRVRVTFGAAGDMDFDTWPFRE
jgi:hypothetical protein